MDLISLAIKHIEAENQHDVKATMDTISDAGADYKIFSSRKFFNQRKKIEDFYSEIIDAIPDMHVEVENIIQDKDKRQVCAQYKLTGTHKGNLWGLAPTNKKITYNGSIIYEFDENGKMIKEHTYFDKTELLSSIGAIKDASTPMGVFLLFMFQSPFYAVKCAWVKLFGNKKS